MQSGDLKVTNGATAGAWIEPRLGGDFGAVTLQVPKGFEGYARVLHPASDPEGDPVSWAEVARVCGTTAHRQMQWHAVAGIGSKWAGSDPPVGAMDIQTLDALYGILASHSPDAARCFFGLCTIEGWLDSFSAEELEPLLELPYDREHIVLTGPLSALDQIAFDWSKSSLLWVARAVEDEAGPPPEPGSSEFLRRQAPNLIWPADQSWLVASEVDFDSTLVGGSCSLIEAIVESPELEAWQVDPTDSLAADADKINL